MAQPASSQAPQYTAISASKASLGRYLFQSGFDHIRSRRLFGEHLERNRPGIPLASLDLPELTSSSKTFRPVRHFCHSRRLEFRKTGRMYISRRATQDRKSVV